MLPHALRVCADRTPRSFQTGRFLGTEGHDVHETGLMQLPPMSKPAPKTQTAVSQIQFKPYTDDELYVEYLMGTSENVYFR